ncbi:unnamed protein product [Moneuplotes crassus]|uniref:Actin-related protein 2/3 complex subunit 4 n=1 Tax=Euplotes crassus TaxID=5936 RepID=A0AAD1Y0D0_EUPCR|nr:unnamed protein product [Moneuplotes crassus]CAI2381992.1 unnamed protein product [Moneuplotes crassus]
MSKRFDAYGMAIKDALNILMTLRRFPSQIVEKQTHPEVEFQDNKDLLMKPFVIARSEKDMCYIETSVNSIRISLKVKKSSDTEELLVHLFERFIALRADRFGIIRKKPAIEGYDFSFLITDEHLEKYKKEEIINFILEFILGIEKEISDMRMMIHTRLRVASGFFVKSVSQGLK